MTEPMDPDRIRVKCPQCKKTWGFAKKDAGKRGKCRNCDAVLEITEELPPVTATLVQPPVPQPNAAKTGSLLPILLVCIAVPVLTLAVIGGIVMRNVGGATDDARNDVTRILIRSIKDGISYYQIRMDSLPDSLEELVEGPNDAAKKAKWNRPILTEVPLDAWKNEFVYSRNGDSYEIRSAGADGQINTRDDIVD